MSGRSGLRLRQRRRKCGEESAEAIVLRDEKASPTDRRKGRIYKRKEQS